MAKANSEVLHPAITAGRREMQSEGISRKRNRHAVIRRYVHSRRARCSDALNCDLFGCECDLVIGSFLDDRVNYVLVGLVRICPANHRDLPQVVLERIIAQLWRNDLKTAIHQSHEYQNSDDRLN